MPTDELVLTKEDGVGILTLNRPEKMNAMTTEMWQGLREIVEEVGKDDDIKVLVITGTGRAFCAGSDVVKRLAARIDGDASGPSRSELLEPIGHVATLLRGLKKPVIAAVNGAAAGAGLSIALLADIRIASDQARFGAAWVKIGLIPDLGSTYLMPKVVGIEKALELMYTGDIIDARQAEQIGLVGRVVPHEELMGAAMELARKIAQGPAVTIGWIKQAAYASLNNTLEEHLLVESYGQAVARNTEYHMEGVAAFAEKRKPAFRGR